MRHGEDMERDHTTVRIDLIQRNMAPLAIFALR
jgi:hypothetical protein